MDEIDVKCQMAMQSSDMVSLQNLSRHEASSSSTLRHIIRHVAHVLASLRSQETTSPMCLELESSCQLNPSPNVTILQGH